MIKTCGPIRIRENEHGWDEAEIMAHCVFRVGCPRIRDGSFILQHVVYFYAAVNHIKDAVKHRRERHVKAREYLRQPARIGDVPRDDGWQVWCSLGLHYTRPRCT